MRGCGGVITFEGWKVEELKAVLAQELRYFSRQFPRRTLEFYEPMNMPVVRLSNERGTVVEVTPSDAYVVKVRGEKTDATRSATLTRSFTDLRQVLSNYVKLTCNANVCVGNMTFRDGERLTDSGT